MEVILLESLNKLGKIGDVVSVKDGFARNYLIPQKKALRANKENKDYYAKIKDDVLKKNKESISSAESIIKQISTKEIIFIRNASDNGQLYGSVSPKDISNYFSDNKIDIKPSNINLHNAIKKIGIYDINIKLHAEVSCNLKINVATSTENAKIQKADLNKKVSDDNKEKDVSDTEKIITKKSVDKKSLENEQIKTADKEKVIVESKPPKSSDKSEKIDADTNAKNNPDK